MSNQFDAWVKGKIVILPCGCETHHGNDPVGGYLKICATHSRSINAGPDNLEGLWPRTVPLDGLK